MTNPRLLRPLHDLPSDLGVQIKAARKARGWTQARLASKVGVARQTIARIEAGSADVAANGTPAGVSRASMPGAKLLEALNREEVLNGAIRLPRTWEMFDDPDVCNRGFRARAARLVAGKTLSEVGKEAGLSGAALSQFERNLFAPEAIVGAERDEDEDSIKNDAYARAVGFADADEMTAYLHSRAPLDILKGIAARLGRPLPATALLPTNRRPPRVEG